MGCDEAIGTFGGVLAVVIGGEIFCIVKLASGTRDLLFVRLLILISHHDSAVSLQWVVVRVTSHSSLVGVNNVQFSWALFRPVFGATQAASTYGTDNDHVCSVEYRLPRI